MTCRRLDATTRKLLSPEHVWKTTRPNKYRDAIIKMTELLDSSDHHVRLKAAEKIINHTKGTPKQSVDVTTLGDKISSQPVFVTSDADLQAAIKRIATGE